MNNETKNRGIRRAIAAGNGRLPMNFTDRTMQIIAQQQARREERNEKIHLWCVAIFAVLLSGASIFVIWRRFGHELFTNFVASLKNAFQAEEYIVPTLLFCLSVAILQAFDRWMRRQYYKRHNITEAV